MKKIISIIALALCIVLFGCGKNNNSSKKDDLYFDYTGIAETTHIAYTKENTFDLKTVFKVGNRISSYNEKKIGETTYDDIRFYLYLSYEQSEFPTENEDVSISSDGIVTRKRLCTAVIYAGLKEEPDVSEEEKYNGGMHVLTLFFGNEKTFGTWEAENGYLDSWINHQKENGDPNAKKGTMTLEFREDFTYTITLTEGYWGTMSIDDKIPSKVITGKLQGLCSDGARRYDDGGKSYPFEIIMNSYHYNEEEKYTLFTGINLDDSNSYFTYRFLPKESEA